MDRLSALVAYAYAVAVAVAVAVVPAVMLAACDSSSGGEPPRSRVDAVKATAGKGPSIADLCDVHYEAEKAPVFEMPAVAGRAPARASGWRWINVWATWCKPCLEELPRLASWRGKLGARVSLEFVSADESDEVVASFRAKHADAPEGPRIVDAAALAAWLPKVGLDAEAPIPLHVFVDPAGKTRCVRSGAVRDGDLAAVERLVR
jgi:thiol-disulfide isomerase/thioredoxin